MQTYKCFIDYQKAFNRVEHNKLMKILEKVGVPNLRVAIDRKHILQKKCSVLSEQNITESVNISRGVKQGCTLSPIYINLYNEKLMQEA